MEKEEKINELEKKIFNLLDQLENYKNTLKGAENSFQKLDKLEREIHNLKEDNTRLKNKLGNTHINNLHLSEEVKRLKIVNAISGNHEYKQMMKQRMNKLIKEVDTCIAQIKTNN